VIRHAIPYTQPSNACLCPLQPCGGINPSDTCPDHGHRRNPAMEWHQADNTYCQQLANNKETVR
jgi:hypothetical protein